jgi:hypothetical protein
MKNIHVLPTDKPSRLHITSKLMLYPNGLMPKSQGLCKNQHIYITSKEYIGLSYYLDGDLVRKGVIDDKDYWEVRKDYEKIILTTDPKLIEDGVQAIDDEFLEWFVKNPSCEYIKTEKEKVILGEVAGTTYIDYNYKIIIPKEEPKQTAQEYEQQGMEKYAHEFKQETLEEAYLNKLIDEANKEFTLDRKLAKDVAIKYAKWQQEQDKKLYSEEDVRGMLEDMSRYVSTKEMRDDFVGVGYSEWVRKRDWFVNHLIEQFKKK